MIIIRECNEPLVDVKKICPNVKIDLGRRRMKLEKTAYLRKSVALMIKKAEKQLPSGITFIINDAWRPQHVQQQIKQRFIFHFTKKHTGWSQQKVLHEVEKYVAPANGKHASGHMTGGAVDLRLWSKGRKLPMKSSKLNFQENAKSIQPKLPKYIKRNRQLMFDSLKKVGLSNYAKEYWHWSYGDIQWAKRVGKKQAIYGVINNF